MTNTASKNEKQTTKRPRAPIACYRCHHKKVIKGMELQVSKRLLKVRCDGIHPNCTRCLSTGVLCAYPSSRRSRNTQPTNVDPFINNLSQLETKIRKIESDLESQRDIVYSLCGQDNSVVNVLNSRIVNTEKDLQESRSIIAQLRLRGEQRVSRGRKAAANSTLSNCEKNAGSNTGLIKQEDHYSTLGYPDSSFQDWMTPSSLDNVFVDPMIIAAAENPMPFFPMFIDTDRSHALSHLPSPPVHDNSLFMPQTSCSSTTTTSSSSSFGVLNDQNPLYDDSYIQFMNNNELMFMDQLTE